jgi:hypothetical protein
MRCPLRWFGGGGLRSGSKGRKYFFLEKKKQKTFVLQVDAAKTTDP